jgi:hypothetical protein
MRFVRSGAGQSANGLARFLGVAILAAALSLTSACMTSKVDETRQIATSIQEGESIVILKRPQLEGIGTEEAFLDCVQENLGGQLLHPEKGQTAKRYRKSESVQFNIYGEQEFTDALFPWFEPSTAPANAGGLKSLLERPGVAGRLREIGVRYVVWVDGNTRKTDGGGAVSCAVGPGGGGCIGLGWWEKESGYLATVWDMQNGSEIGTVSADVNGTSVLIGAIAPIPIITPVRSTACNRLSDQLRSFLNGSDLAGAGGAAAASAGSR